MTLLIKDFDTPKFTPFPPTADKNNSIVKFCVANGGTFIPEKLDKCLLPNNIKFYTCVLLGKWYR